MRKIQQNLIDHYREITYHTNPRDLVKTLEQAVEFVNERGFIYFWPIKDVELPSLWVSVAGNRPVASAHDDPGHVTWNWKDSLLGRDAWYYAKVLRKKATIISMDTAPFFYALTENYGSPEEDYLTIYEQGKMTQEAKAVYEALLDKGPLDTISLRKSAHLSRQESGSRFNRALSDLQADFKICPIGVTEAGAWRYAFLYDILPRHYPDIPENARFISEKTARLTLCEQYFKSVGAARLNDVEKLFRWRKADTLKAVNTLASDGILKTDVQLGESKDTWIVLSSVLLDEK